ncbi:MAG TPA: hypothetical protein VMZ53_31790 [Kofleriaceae bacterium]|nr:hypothetical protein [Kofleriaceae bacterium]
MKRALVLSLVLAACSDATNNAATQLNLDRPVDVAFACYGGLRLNTDSSVVASAQAIASCDIRSAERAADAPKPIPPGQEDRPGQPVPSVSWYAFILQSGPGTVAVARFEAKPASTFSAGDVAIQDADPLTPGKNSISVGEDPIAIATDKIGCKEVIANAGSCDLSILDVNKAIAGVYTPTDREASVSRLEVKNAAGAVIRAKPAAMAFEPAGGNIGDACPSTATGIAYIAYPGCHLVAGVDVGSGTMVTAISFETGVPVVVTDTSAITCPAECDGTMAPTPGLRPVTVDLERDERTNRSVLAIGSENSNAVAIFDLDSSNFRPLSQIPVPPLQNTNGRLGITSLAISPVIGMGGTTGIIDDSAQSSQHQFIYAVANDSTVRVVDIGDPTGDVPVECDTQVDPRYIKDIRDVDRLACFPNQKFETSPATCTTNTDCGSDKFCLVDPSATPAGTKRCTLTPPRRPGARGPGIELIGDAVPTSVDFFRADSQGVTNDVLRLIGHFAMITAAAGQTYVVNVDNDDYPDFVSPDVGKSDRLRTQIPLVIAHQLRDAVPDRGKIAEEASEVMGAPATPVCDDPGPDPDSNAGNSGGARAAANPSRTVPAGVLAPEKYGGLPSIRQVLCESPKGNAPVSELSFSAPIPVREAVFPDLRGLRADEVWTLTWEGSLSLDKVDAAIDGPSIRYSQTLVDGGGMRLVDQTRPFCDAGVEPYDIVQLRGCDPAIGDAGCPVGYTCYVHPQSQVAGLGACMLTDEAERLANACRDFLVSLRRYTVGRTKSGELQILPRKHELRTTPLDGCVDDAQCHDLANYAIHNVNSANPKDDTTSEDAHTYYCRVDNDRKPKAGTGKRCLMACMSDTDCATGTICRANAEAAPSMGYCMEGVVPPQSCVNAPQRYELRAGEAFSVVGSRQGFLHSIISDTSGNCIRDPNANPFMVGRLPLTAPACDPTADPLTGRLPNGTFEPNPCKASVDETEYMLNYIPNTCSLNNPDENLITRMAEAIRFRNRAVNLTVVDPTYPGDAQCHGDRQGGRTNVPLVSPGFQMAFRITGGFAPLPLSISPSYPVKVLRGPQQSIWVVDEGDFLSTSVTTPSTRGKVFRVESRAIGVVNLVD